MLPNKLSRLSKFAQPKLGHEPFCVFGGNLFSYLTDPPDYLSLNSTTNILSGTPNGTTFCTSVSIVDDGVLENEERVFLNLGSLSPVVAVEEGLGTQALFIIDNERKSS